MENIKLEDFTKYKFLSGVKFSPDGSHACFAVHQADIEENKYFSNLWLYNCSNEKYIRLTSFNNESSFIWMDDNENILFPGLRNQKDREKQELGEEFTQFYKINIHGGEAQEAFRIPREVGDIREINNKTFLFTAKFKANEVDIEGLNETEKAEELKRRKEEKDYEVLDEIPFWSNGAGFINKQRNRLYMYELETGKMIAVTKELMDVEYFNINEDRTKIVFTAKLYKDIMLTSNDIYIYDIKSEKLQKITPSDGFSYGYVDFISKDKLIYQGTDMKRYGINENDKFYILNLDNFERKCITPDFETSTWNSVGSDCRYGRSDNVMVDEEHLYFITTEEDSSYINRIDINGRIEKLVKNRGAVNGYTVKNGKILLIGMRNMKLQEIYKLDCGNEIQVTDFNGWLEKNKKIAYLEKMSVETEPGVLIDGWVMKPVNFDNKKRYPGILDIHGGPKTVYGEVFFHEMQYWANEGYFVFFCNPRGSDGRGNEFSDIRGKYGTIDYNDLMKFTDAVLKKYKNIDSERIGVTGGSYGGFMTNWIIGQTDRFKAAASQRSISNWISKFCTTDIGYYFVEDQQNGTPWNDYEKLWWHSPLKYADKVKTPTLFLHSEEDYRCWIAEGIQMFTALKYHNVEARLCMFRGENHELSRSGKPRHRARRLKEITDWFNHYLKNEGTVNNSSQPNPNH